MLNVQLSLKLSMSVAVKKGVDKNEKNRCFVISIYVAFKSRKKKINEFKYIAVFIANVIQ